MNQICFTKFYISFSVYVLTMLNLYVSFYNMYMYYIIAYLTLHASYFTNVFQLIVLR